MSYFRLRRMAHAQPPLIDTIEAFLAAHSMSAITFGRKALRDPHFVSQLRAGRRCWPETEAKVRQFMEQHSARREAA